MAESGRSAREQQKKEMMVSIGQNTAAAEKLTALLERMEHLLDEIDGLKDDLKDLKGQAKDEGFNVAALVRLVAIRRNKGRVDQENELLNDLLLYAHATGTPLDIAHRSTRLRRQQKRFIVRMMISLPKAIGQAKWRRSAACISGPSRTGTGHCVPSWACVPAIDAGPSKSGR